MNRKYSLSDLSDDALDRGIHASAARKHATDAELLAFVAEYDSRRRYVALGYESMHAFCVQALHLSEDSAYKRIQAARVALEFPALFPALAEGRLHLSAVNLLAPYLSVETADALIAAASHKSKAEIRQLLAERFPQEPPARMSLLPAGTVPTCSEAERGNGALHDAPSAEPGQGRVEGSQAQLAPAQVQEVDCWARVTPLSSNRYSLSLTFDRPTLELLRQNQALLSHQVPSGNLAEVLRRALAESARQLEQRTFRSSGTAGRPRRRPAPASRYIPKRVRDAVWRRDGGRCARTSETPDTGAGRVGGCSSITSFPSRAAVGRRWTTCGCGAIRTTSTRRNACSAPRSCATSASTRARQAGSARRRRPGNRGPR